MQCRQLTVKTEQDLWSISDFDQSTSTALQVASTWLTLWLPKWLTHSLSQQYSYIIPQKCDENTQTYQVEVAILI